MCVDDDAMCISSLIKPVSDATATSDPVLTLPDGKSFFVSRSGKWSLNTRRVFTAPASHHMTLDAFRVLMVCIMLHTSLFVSVPAFVVWALSYDGLFRSFFSTLHSVRNFKLWLLIFATLWMPMGVLADTHVAIAVSSTFVTLTVVCLYVLFSIYKYQLITTFLDVRFRRVADYLAACVDRFNTSTRDRAASAAAGVARVMSPNIAPVTPVNTVLAARASGDVLILCSLCKSLPLEPTSTFADIYGHVLAIVRSVHSLSACAMVKANGKFPHFSHASMGVISGVISFLLNQQKKRLRDLTSKAGEGQRNSKVSFSLNVEPEMDIRETIGSCYESLTSILDGGIAKRCSNIKSLWSFYDFLVIKFTVMFSQKAINNYRLYQTVVNTVNNLLVSPDTIPTHEDMVFYSNVSSALSDLHAYYLETKQSVIVSELARAQVRFAKFVAVQERSYSGSTKSCPMFVYVWSEPGHGKTVALKPTLLAALAPLCDVEKAQISREVWSWNTEMTWWDTYANQKFICLDDANAVNDKMESAKILAFMLRLLSVEKVSGITADLNKFGCVNPAPEVVTMFANAEHPEMSALVDQQAFKRRYSVHAKMHCPKGPAHLDEAKFLVTSYPGGKKGLEQEMNLTEFLAHIVKVKHIENVKNGEARDVLKDIAEGDPASKISECAIDALRTIDYGFHNPYSEVLAEMDEPPPVAEIPEPDNPDVDDADEAHSVVSDDLISVISGLGNAHGITPQSVQQSLAHSVLLHSLMQTYPKSVPDKFKSSTVLAYRNVSRLPYDMNLAEYHYGAQHSVILTKKALPVLFSRALSDYVAHSRGTHSDRQRASDVLHEQVAVLNNVYLSENDYLSMAKKIGCFLAASATVIAGYKLFSHIRGKEVAPESGEVLRQKAPTPATAAVSVAALKKAIGQKTPSSSNPQPVKSEMDASDLVTPALIQSNLASLEKRTKHVVTLTYVYDTADEKQKSQTSNAVVLAGDYILVPLHYLDLMEHGEVFVSCTARGMEKRRIYPDITRCTALLTHDLMLVYVPRLNVTGPSQKRLVGSRTECDLTIGTELIRVSANGLTPVVVTSVKKDIKYRVVLAGHEQVLNVQAFETTGGREPGLCGAIYCRRRGAMDWRMIGMHIAGQDDKRYGVVVGTKVLTALFNSGSTQISIAERFAGNTALRGVVNVSTLGSHSDLEPTLFECDLTFGEKVIPHLSYFYRDGEVTHSAITRLKSALAAETERMANGAGELPPLVTQVLRYVGVRKADRIYQKSLVAHNDAPYRVYTIKEAINGCGSMGKLDLNSAAGLGVNGKTKRDCMFMTIENDTEVWNLLPEHEEAYCDFVASIERDEIHPASIFKWCEKDEALPSGKDCRMFCSASLYYVLFLRQHYGYFVDAATSDPVMFGLGLGTSQFKHWEDMAKLFSEALEVGTLDIKQWDILFVYEVLDVLLEIFELQYGISPLVRRLLAVRKYLVGDALFFFMTVMFPSGMFGTTFFGSASNDLKVYVAICIMILLEKGVAITQRASMDYDNPDSLPNIFEMVEETFFGFFYSDDIILAKTRNGTDASNITLEQIRRAYSSVWGMTVTPGNKEDEVAMFHKFPHPDHEFLKRTFKEYVCSETDKVYWFAPLNLGSIYSMLKTRWSDVTDQEYLARVCGGLRYELAMHDKVVFDTIRTVVEPHLPPGFDFGTYEDALAKVLDVIDKGGSLDFIEDSEGVVEVHAEMDAPTDLLVTVGDTPTAQADAPADENPAPNVNILGTGTGNKAITPIIASLYDRLVSIQGTRITDWFSRPQLIKTFPITNATGADSFLFDEPLVTNLLQKADQKEKIKYFSRFRYGKIRVRITVGPTISHMGLLQFSLVPWPSLAATHDRDRQRISCVMNSVYTNESMLIGEDDTVDLEAAWVSARQRESIGLSAADANFTEHWTLRAMVAGECNHASNSATNLDLNVYCWFEDFEMDAPTVSTTELLAEMDSLEFVTPRAMKNVKRIAETAATVLAGLSNPRVEVTETGFTTGADTTVVSKQPAVTLGVSEENSTVAVRNDDLSIKAIGEREQWYEGFRWTSASLHGTSLIDFFISPAITESGPINTGGRGGKFIHMNAHNQIALIAKYYSFDSVCVRIICAAPRNASGRMLVTFDPLPTPAATMSIASSKSTRAVEWNINHNLTLKMDIPWTDIRPVLASCPIVPTDTIARRNTTNGHIRVYVASRLTIADNSITGVDCRFMMHFKNLRLHIPNPMWFDEHVLTLEESGTVGFPVLENTDQHVQAEMDVVEDPYAGSVGVSYMEINPPQYEDVYFGEHIDSLKSFVSRPSYHNTPAFPSSTSYHRIRAIYGMYPITTTAFQNAFATGLWWYFRSMFTLHRGSMYHYAIGVPGPALSNTTQPHNPQVGHTGGDFFSFGWIPARSLASIGADLVSMSQSSHTAEVVERDLLKAVSRGAVAGAPRNAFRTVLHVPYASPDVFTYLRPASDPSGKSSRNLPVVMFDYIIPNPAGNTGTAVEPPFVAVGVSPGDDYVACYMRPVTFVLMDAAGTTTIDNMFKDADYLA